MHHRKSHSPALRFSCIETLAYLVLQDAMTIQHYLRERGINVCPRVTTKQIKCITQLRIGITTIKGRQYCGTS